MACSVRTTPPVAVGYSGRIRISNNKGRITHLAVVAVFSVLPNPPLRLEAASSARQPTPAVVCSGRTTPMRTLVPSQLAAVCLVARPWARTRRSQRRVRLAVLVAVCSERSQQHRRSLQLVWATQRSAKALLRPLNSVGHLRVELSSLPCSRPSRSPLRPTSPSSPCSLRLLGRAASTSTSRPTRRSRVCSRLRCRRLSCMSPVISPPKVRSCGATLRLCVPRRRTAMVLTSR